MIWIGANKILFLWNPDCGWKIMHESIMTWKHFLYCWLSMGESTGGGWIPLPKATIAELLCYNRHQPDGAIEQTIKLPVIWDAMTLCHGSRLLKLKEWNELSWQYFRCIINWEGDRLVWHSKPLGWIVGQEIPWGIINNTCIMPGVTFCFQFVSATASAAVSAAATTFASHVKTV